MSKTFFKISIGLVAVTCLLQAASAAVTGSTRQLTGHVPAVVSRLTSTSRVASTNHIHLAIGLPLRNQEGLNALLAQIYDPTSSNYHHYLTPDEFVTQFGPTEADYQSVLNFAKTNGFTVTATTQNRTILDVDGKVSDIERAFHVTMQNYQHPTQARQFYAPTVEPSLDAALPILAVGGLNNYAVASPLYRRGTSLGGSSKTRFSTGSSPAGTYWGYDFRNAYAPGVTLTGTGQKVALFECDGYYPTDISTYLTQCGLPAVTLTNILIDGFSGTPSGFGGEIEVALDIDMANAMAPGLSQIMVYEGPNDTPAYNLDILNRIATDNQAKQISSSWLIDDSPQFAQVYTEFALQGQSFFQASGDSGSYYPGIFQFEDSPLVTLVGGTTLTSTTGAGGVWQSEQVWNNGFDPFAGHEWAGGGGVSSVYSIPTWQKWINMTTNQGSTTMRNIPDVSLTADNIYIIGDSSVISDEGGTSAAAPLWAGFMALVNQQTLANKGTPVGFINPTIYGLAQSANYTNIFHDIVTGNNTNNVNTTLYSAVPGYDLATGLGTPNGSNFITAFLSANSNAVPAIISAPAPAWGNTLSVMNGSNPNGAWFLFVQDDAKVNVGMINNGWSVSIASGTPVGAPADNQIYAPTNISLALNATTNIYLAVTNYGPASATNVVITDTLPVSGLTLNSVTPTNNVSIIGSILTWKLGNLPINSGGAITLRFSGTVTGTYTNSPTITSSTTDPNPDDKFADTIISVAQPVPPQLSAYTTSNGRFILSITNDANLTTVIQATTNLISPTWVNIFTGTPPFTTNIDVLTNYPSRFYRAVIGQ